MTRLCERPGCSEPGAAAYGMIPEDLIFWIAALAEAPIDDHNLLCRRHADAMVVPRGWTLDDRREDTLRLFKPQPGFERPHSSRSRRRRPRSDAVAAPEQLRINVTDEIDRPAPAGPPDGRSQGVDPDTTPDAGVDPIGGDRFRTDRSDAEEAAPWQPEFDAHDDLDGLLEVTSPLLARAFRGTGRPRR